MGGHGIPLGVLCRSFSFILYSTLMISSILRIMRISDVRDWIGSEWSRLDGVWCWLVLVGFGVGVGVGVGWCWCWC